MIKKVIFSWVNDFYGFSLFSDMKETNVEKDAILTQEDATAFGYENVEQLARAKCKTQPFFSYAPGDVFVTDAPNLVCRKVIHAVTMRTPGSKAKISNIIKLIPKIIATAEHLNIESVAVPLLGCGTGRLDTKVVQELLADNLISDKVTFYIVDFS